MNRAKFYPVKNVFSNSKKLNREILNENVSKKTAMMKNDLKCLTTTKKIIKSKWFSKFA